MDLLKRSLAPITEQAWQEIDDEAREILKEKLTARKIVDVEGPFGWDFSAKALGEIKFLKNEKKGQANYGLHQVQPTVEVRVDFKLKRYELDNIERGALAPELDPVREAANTLAQFEEKTIYNGLDKAGIKGLAGASEHEAILFSGEAKALLGAVAQGIKTMKDNGVGGPYSLVLGPDSWLKLVTEVHAYPLQKQIRDILGGQLIVNPALEDAMLVSVRGGDMLMSLGQDISIGYQSATADDVQLFITESFTFTVPEPLAIVSLKK